MNLIKENIHMNRIKSKTRTQINTNEDFIVPDVLPDISKVISINKLFEIDNTKVTDGHLTITGRVSFNILYSSPDTNLLNKLSTELPIKEVLNIDSLSAGDIVNLSYTFDDISINIINSRKIGIRCIIDLYVLSEFLYDIEAPIDISDSDDIEYIKEIRHFTSMCCSRKDVFRIKDEYELPKSKQNIDELIWSTLSLKNTSIKAEPNLLIISGIAVVFILYKADNTLVWHEQECSFNSELTVDGISDETTNDIRITGINPIITCKPDYDGENRVINYDIAISVDIKAYKDTDVELLCDLYSNKYNLLVEYDDVIIDNVKTIIESKNKATYKAKANLSSLILQIASSICDSKILNSYIEDNKINVEGIIACNILFITEDDTTPINSVFVEFPFTQYIQLENNLKNCEYELSCSTNSILVNVNGTDEFDISVLVSISASITHKLNQNMIYSINKTDIDPDYVKSIPGMISYLVKSDDSLWSIAKAHHTTINSLKEINSLTSDNIKTGTRLLIVKEL